MNVTFDSNVWEKIIAHEMESNKIFSDLHKLIVSGKITPYICEIAISLESIMKKDRLNFFIEYQPKFETTTIGTTNNPDGTTTFHCRASFSPDTEAHPGLHPILKTNLEQASKLGFKVLHMTNIGTVRSLEIPKEMYCSFDHVDDYWDYANKLSDLSSFIEKQQCGRYEYYQLKKTLGFQEYSVFHILKTVDKKSRSVFAKAIAEWVDGESISAHYAHGNDIFCSEDNARSTGNKSVFSKEKRDLLRTTYNLQIISTQQLLNLF